MRVNRIDHLALTVADNERTLRFYLELPGNADPCFITGDTIEQAIEEQQYRADP
jgi:hypothetical protein